MVRRLTIVAGAILALGGAAHGADDPGIMGTWSTNCRKLPITETLHIDLDSVQLGDRHCIFVDWKNTVIGWYSPLACSTEGHINTGQILVVKKSPTQILVDFDGLNGTLSKCDAPTGASSTLPQDITTRLEGVWARDRKACELYKTGEFDKPGYDTTTLSRFGVATFENGKFEMLASPVRCQISQSGNPEGEKYVISAQCQVKDYPKRTSTGAVSFGPSGSLHLDLRSGDFGEINFVKCD